ncbi:hypothetical protein CRUP_021946 [Coryphaenoides rupestris]|nr:hypothetical protein CRUP_021946 [Coryphaenoides rupestris]
MRRCSSCLLSESCVASFSSDKTGMSSSLWESDNGSTVTTSCSNSTQSAFLKEVKFGGIPIVLLLDFCVFLVLLILFSIIRTKLWDYGRLALVSESNGFNESTHRRYGRMTSVSGDPETEAGCCSWLPFVLRMDSEKVKSKCGIDAVLYLSFQRHLIFLLAIVTATSLIIILPVNLSGDLLDPDPYSFGRTTIGNLQNGNHLLWLHTVFAVLYLILTVVLLRHYTSKMKGMRRESARNTLFVRSVPKEATEELLKTHFMEAYPTCQVSAVTLGYDVAKLMHLDNERVRVRKNLRYYEKELERTGTRGLINPQLCGYLCCCCACCKRAEVDAIEYYSHQEAALVEELSKQRELVPQRPLGMAFVTLQSEAMAKYILKDFNALDCGGGVGGVGEDVGGHLGCGCCCSGWEPQPSAHSASLKVKRENLSVQGVCWWIRFLLLNVFLVVLLTFFTTPSIIITTLDKFDITKPISYLNNAVVSQFFPTLLLWSSEQLSMMHKLYIFLMFMVLILPSLGLTSIAWFLRWLFDKHFLIDGKLRCVFLPDQGAFFVNYVIAAALLGSGMELLRLPGLLLYTIRMMLARSAAERKYVKQNQAYEFEYGAMYSWNLWFMADTSLFTLVVLCITIFIAMGYKCFGNFKYLSPHNYSVKEEDEETDENAEHTTAYLPRVLSTLTPEDVKPPASYGSTESSPAHTASPVDDHLLLA